jgi:chorismate mutase/prephenate dehydratase
VGVDEAVEKLKGFRGSIDSLDGKILDLLNQRATVALEIGATKRAAGLPVVELTRERAVIEGMGSRNAGPLSNEAIERIYTAIMLEMRRLQE